MDGLAAEGEEADTLPRSVSRRRCGREIGGGRWGKQVRKMCSAVGWGAEQLKPAVLDAKKEVSAHAQRKTLRARN